MGKFNDYSKATSLLGDETLLVLQNGAVKRASVEELMSASPNNMGVYPDVPLNRVTIKRFVNQDSTQVVTTDNLGMIDKIFSLFFPCLIDRNSRIVAYLNGKDVTKTVDGLPATLDDYTMQAMVRIGGFWMKYEYDAITNTKIEKYSIYKVRGYKYVRRRFFPMYGGVMETQGGKELLLSNANKWTTQNRNIVAYHTAAKNLGDNFRAIALQDYNIYRKMFFLWKKDYNSQKFYDITGFDWNKWNATPNPDPEANTNNFCQLYKTGITNSILGMEGKMDAQTFTYADGSTKTFNPYKFLWAEGFLSGPYWIRTTGALKQNHKWYVAKDINTCTSFSIDDNHEYICDAPKTNGWIYEDFEDTMFPSALGASDSKGLCDYFWTNETDTTSVFIPLVVGSALNGSYIGCSCLSSGNVVSSAVTDSGSALASDDPTDLIADGTIAA